MSAQKPKYQTPVQVPVRKYPDMIVAHDKNGREEIIFHPTHPHASAFDAADCPQCVARWDTVKIQRQNALVQDAALKGERHEKAKLSDERRFRLRGLNARSKKTKSEKYRLARVKRVHSGTEYLRQNRKRNALLEALVNDQEAQLMRAGDVEPNPGFNRPYTSSQVRDLTARAQHKLQEANLLKFSVTKKMPKSYAEAAASAAASAPTQQQLAERDAAAMGMCPPGLSPEPPSAAPKPKPAPNLPTPPSTPPAPNQAQPPTPPPAVGPPLSGSVLSEEELKVYVATLLGDPRSVVLGPAVPITQAIRLPGDEAAVRPVAHPMILQEFSFIAPDYLYLPRFVQHLLFHCRCSSSFANLKFTLFLLAHWRWLALIGWFFVGIPTLISWGLFIAVLAPIGDFLNILGHTGFLWRRRTVVYCPTLVAAMGANYDVDVDVEVIAPTLRQKLRSVYPSLPLDSKLVAQVLDDTQRICAWYLTRGGRGNGQPRSAGWLLSPCCRSASDGDSVEGNVDDGSESGKAEPQAAKSSPEAMGLSSPALNQSNPTLEKVRSSYSNLERMLNDLPISADYKAAISERLAQLVQTEMTQPMWSRLCTSELSGPPPPSIESPSSQSEPSSEGGSQNPDSSQSQKSPPSNPGSNQQVMPMVGKTSCGEPLKKTTSDGPRDGSADA